MSFDPSLILDPNEVQSFVTPEQAINYLREQIQAIRDHIARQPPPPTQVIGAVTGPSQAAQIQASAKYMSWHNRLLITYGRAVGAICSAQAFGHVTVEEFQELKKQLIAVTVRREARFQMQGT
jgi:hypothetical protein